MKRIFSFLLILFSLGYSLSPSELAEQYKNKSLNLPVHYRSIPIKERAGHSTTKEKSKNETIPQNDFQKIEHPEPSQNNKYWEEEAQQRDEIKVENKYLEEDTYFGARYYDNFTGRWISRDPISGNLVEPGTLNRYIYVLNNPLIHIDPNGEELVNVLISPRVAKFIMVRRTGTQKNRGLIMDSSFYPKFKELVKRVIKANKKIVVISSFRTDKEQTRIHDLGNGKVSSHESATGIDVYYADKDGKMTSRGVANTAKNRKILRELGFRPVSEGGSWHHIDSGKTTSQRKKLQNKHKKQIKKDKGNHKKLKVKKLRFKNEKF